MLKENDPYVVKQDKKDYRKEYEDLMGEIYDEIEKEEAEEEEKEKEFHFEKDISFKSPTSDKQTKIDPLPKEEPKVEKKKIVEYQYPKNPQGPRVGKLVETEIEVPIEKEDKVEPVNKPRGWHLKKEFIDDEGNVFQKGKFITRGEEPPLKKV